MRHEIFFLSVLLALVFLPARAQTFQFDPTICGQVTTMETGAGALTPPAYYNTSHKSYQAEANILNKSYFRSKNKTEAEKQVALADTTKRVLLRRAVIAEMDRVSSDPSLDAAWKIEGPKIEARMSTFKRNIEKITGKGGTTDDYRNWLQTYNCLQTAINITRKSYLTHGQRQKEYIAIYKQILSKLTLLSSQFSKWAGYKMADNFQKAGITIRRLTKNSTIAYGCLGTWQEKLGANEVNWKRKGK